MSFGATQPPPTISAILSTFNGEGILARQLEALTRQDYEGSWEVVIADNGSTEMLFSSSIRTTK